MIEVKKKFLHMFRKADPAKTSKIVKYWITNYTEYKNVIVGIYKDLRSKPSKVVYLSLFGAGSYYLASQNPDKDSYCDKILENSQKLMFVGENIRNQRSLECIRTLEQKLADNLVHRINFLLFSVIWFKDSRDDCDLYKTVCPYLRPSLRDYFQRFGDVGALNRWFLMEEAMKDYDIKEEDT